MKFVYQDLLSFLNKKPSKDLLSEKLFQLGHEHEIHEDIYDIDFTPNRGDCLSLAGLSRDLNFFFGKSEDLDIFEGEIDIFNFNFNNLSTNDCPKISFLEIEIKKKPNSYKPYLENYFKYLGNKKTNFFTDISNYISYELGQPTHCFDAEILQNNLTFENKSCNLEFETLLGTKIDLKHHNCVFTSNDEIVSLAGIMGGATTACSSTTKKVVVECAYFNPEAIIGKSIKYNLTSDAAHKFERGVDIKSQEYVLRRFIKIVSDHAEIKSIKLKSFESKEFNSRYLRIEIDEINKILGINLGESEFFKYLEALGFEVSDKIKVPSYRHDIKSQNDLAEEIARLIGYDMLPNDPVSLDINFGKDKSDNIFLVKSFLIQNGFSEVINFPFSTKKSKESIVIDNPLDKNKRFLRQTMRDSLVENFIYNQRRQKDSIKLFEISNIYTNKNEFNQECWLGMIIGGRLGTNYRDFSKKLDAEYFHNLLNKNKLNDYFNITQISSNELTSKKKEKVFYAEALLEDIPIDLFENILPVEKSDSFKKYQKISEYPLSSRDFSFSVSNLLKIEEILELIDNIEDPILKESYMFDFYKDESKNLVKLGYRFTFQSIHKTLSEEEINNKVHELIGPIMNLNGVYIDGM